MEFSINAINDWLGNYYDKHKNDDELNKYIDWSGSDYLDAAVTLKVMLWQKIHIYIRSFPMDAIVIGPLVYDDKHRPYLAIRFTQEALWRDSLWQPPETPEWRNYAVRNGKYGTDNIVRMLNSGYDAAGHVYGTWHGRRIISLQHLNAIHFLNRAIWEYNGRAPLGVLAELTDEYR